METEMTEEIMESTEQESSGTEAAAPESSTELTDIFQEETTENVMLVTVDDSASVELLTQIAADVRIILLFTIITFCSACMRGWRNVVLKTKG